MVELDTWYLEIKDTPERFLEARRDSRAKLRERDGGRAEGAGCFGGARLVKKKVLMNTARESTRGIGKIVHMHS